MGAIVSAAPPRALPDRMREVFLLWCELVGGDPATFDADDVRAFLGRPEVPVLAEAPDAVLRDAASAVCRGHSLPLERWLVAVRVVRPAAYARLERDALDVDDSRAVIKHPGGPFIIYTRAEWDAFVAGVKDSEFDF